MRFINTLSCNSPAIESQGAGDEKSIRRHKLLGGVTGVLYRLWLCRGERKLVLFFIYVLGDQIYVGVRIVCSRVVRCQHLYKYQLLVTVMVCSPVLVGISWDITFVSKLEIFFTHSLVLLQLQSVIFFCFDLRV